jgi:hypothetical protein
MHLIGILSVHHNAKCIYLTNYIYMQPKGRLRTCHLSVMQLNNLTHTGCFTTLMHNVVGIATSYGLDDRGVGVRIFTSPNRPDRL